MNPNELHISDPAFYDEIYASYARPRDTLETAKKGIAPPMSAGGTFDHRLHRLRRGAMDPIFSKANITANAEPIIQAKVDKLCARIGDTIGQSQPLIIDNATMAVAMDIVSEFVFGKATGFLDKPDLGAAIRAQMLTRLRGAKKIAWMKYYWEMLELVPNLASRASSGLSATLGHSKASLLMPTVGEIPLLCEF